MLQKLENIYLAILRMVVIIASGMLLIGSVIYGLGALKGFGDGPSDKINPPEISTKVVIESITAPKTIRDKTLKDEQEQISEDTSIDENQKYYDMAAKAIVSFVARVSNETESLNESDVIKTTKENALTYDSADLINAYAKGFAESLPIILANKKVESLAKNSSSIDVVNEILHTYNKEFNAKIQEENKRISAAKYEFIQAKSDSASNLYIAGACFGLFVLIVFLSIFIKIERNLRQLEIVNQRKPKVKEQV